MRFKASWIVILVTVAVIMLMDAACKKPKPLSDGGVLTFSTDTLTFDTVFTTQGSYTSGVMIYNPQGQEVIVSSVRLQDGASSYFHLNVDGFQGNTISNLKIAAHDSIYVFATVKIDPTDTLTPFIIVDHLIATMNGKDFSIPFTAYGQNAHFIVNDSLIADQTDWKTDKPYVVKGACVIGPGKVLRIPAKCRVYMHQDARFIVYGGLGINLDGSGTDSVVLQGDRLDRGYFLHEEYPGEWGGIWFKPGSLGVIKNTIIKNCGNSTLYNGLGTLAAAIEVDSLAKLYIDNSVIKNSIGYGILGVRGNITATNCLIHTCGAQAFGVIIGGADTMTNCTFANYGTAQVKHITNPTVAILSYFAPGGGEPAIPGTLNTILTNCIIYGSLDSEFYCDNSGGGTSNLTMDHCLFGTGWQIPSFLKTNACKIGQAATGFIDPKFTNPNARNFMLSSSSPAVDAGVPLSWLSIDLAGKPRATSGTTGNDMGCYQHQ
ncbi:MAG: hypothetical protein JWQ38_1765 [Flavipsychrobacter sp.]|nr:hypothetical protein [Flavipsychrobacter sp.]